MKQCPRCLKHTGEVGVHTCTPTEYARNLEAEAGRLREDRDLEKKIRKDTEAQREELTEHTRNLEAQNAKLKKDMADTAQLLEKLAAANGDLGALVTSTSGVLASITKALKGKGYG